MLTSLRPDPWCEPGKRASKPALSVFWLILYAVQLIRRSDVFVMTSEPPSNSSGMRFAKRCTLIPAGAAEWGQLSQRC